MNQCIMHGALLALSLSVLSSGASAQVELPAPYELTPESRYLIGCFDPCDCLLEVFDDLTGRFDLLLTVAGPVSPVYAVLDVNFRIADDLGPESFAVGGGSYSLLNGLVQSEQMLLDLSLNGGPIQTFDSGIDFGHFPLIDLAISLDGMVCFDEVYELVAEPLEPVGESFCENTLNSSGSAGVIRAFGSPAIADNDFTLRADDLPVGTFGLFFFGPDPIQEPFGDGFRCVGGTTQRLPPMLQTDGFGRAILPIDFTAQPDTAGFAPGSTRFFQFAFRDLAAGGAGFNTTDGLQVTFQ